MRTNTVKETWRRGEIAYGAWLSIPDAYAAETMAHVGFDWLCIDMQHGIIDYADAVEMLRVVGPTATVPFVRVPWNEAGIIGKVLDAGAYGVIVPLVNSRAEAEDVVAACRYAPEGRRSYGPNRVVYQAGGEYFERANAEIACIPMIETAAAVDALDEILSVDGIDAVYVGPADLSVTLGMAPGLDNAGPFRDALGRIVAACAEHDIVAGVHCNAELAAARAAAGFRMITVATDVGGMARAAREDLARVRGRARAGGPDYS